MDPLIYQQHFGMEGWVQMVQVAIYSQEALVVEVEAQLVEGQIHLCEVAYSYSLVLKQGLLIFLMKREEIHLSQQNKYKYFDFGFHKQKELSPSSSLALSFAPQVASNDFIFIFLLRFSFFRYSLSIFFSFNLKQAIFQVQDLFCFLNLFSNFCSFQELILQLRSLPLEEYFLILQDLSDYIQWFQEEDQNYHFRLLQAIFLPQNICQSMDQKAVNQHLAFSLDLISRES